MRNTDMQIEHTLYPFLERLAAASGEAILPHFRTNGEVDNKLDGGFDPVTAGDRAGEAAMRALINADHPEHGILGEEYGQERTDAEHVWVLDPIDGTRSFITGLPTWGTLIGLKTANKPSLGMMVQPYVNEAYAGDGTSSWYSGPLGTRQLRTRPCASLSDAVLFTTSPRILKPLELAAYDRIEARARLARYGTDCYAYCMVAAGLADLVIEAGLQPYDIVALVPIIEGAGGVVTTWTGGSPVEGGRIVASGDPRLHDIVLKELSTVPAS